MDAAAMLEQARSMLQSNGLPINAANLNRAVLAISQGTAMPEAMNADEQAAERPAQRSVQSRTRSQGNRTAAAAPSRGEMPMPAPATPSTMDDAGNSVTPVTPNDAIMQEIDRQIAAGGMGSDMSPADTLPVEAAVVPRRGSMPRAQVIDEANPEAGMFAGAPPRQADETGVDALGLATALGMPFAALLGAPAAASRALPQMRVTLNRPQLAGPGAGGTPQLPGTAGMPSVGGPSMPPSVGGPGAQARLSAPQALIERARRRVSETAGRSRRDGMRNE